MAHQIKYSKSQVLDILSQEKLICIFKGLLIFNITLNGVKYGLEYSDGKLEEAHITMAQNNLVLDEEFKSLDELLDFVNKNWDMYNLGNIPHLF